MNKLALSFLVLLFCGIHAPVSAQTDEPYLFVGTYFPLILEKGKGNKVQGVGVDLLNKISEITGDKFKIKVVPWSRALALIRNGHASGLIGPYMNEERKEFMHFTQTHFYEDRMVFLKNTQYDAKWTGDFSLIRDEYILTIKNWSYGDDFDRNRPWLKISETVDSKNAITMLLKGRVDLLAFNERNATAEILEHSLKDKIEICLPHYSEARGYFGFSKMRNEKDLQTRFNAALDQLLKSGEIKRINARYQLPFENK